MSFIVRNREGKGKSIKGRTNIVGSALFMENTVKTPAVSFNHAQNI